MNHPETTFFLVRHGQSENNVLGLLSSWPEKRIFHLTEKGREQAVVAAEKLQGKEIAKIYSSPITRALETARIISVATGIDIVVDERLRETDFGIYDGMSPKVRTAKYATDLDRIDTDIAEIEGLRHERERISAFLVDVMKNDVGKKIVVVSHGDPLELLHGILLGQTIEESLLEWAPENASVTEMMFNGERP
ncbi:MAG: histidine phosphatase family protein [Candidatus Moranbacteria bacterium]|nr:histidine phosphatase family protein [Candidatus Moranbacteria bacterium]